MAIDMQNLIQSFGQQLTQGREIGRGIRLSAVHHNTHLVFDNVSVVGLGGSAFGGEILRNFAFSTCSAPILIHRTYDVPAYINNKSLVIASSYSGNTEETLEAAEKARRQGATIVCITSGGQLRDFAKKYGYGLVELPGGYPPRSAVGFNTLQQLYVLRQYNLIPDFESELEEAIQVVNGFAHHAEAKKLAVALKDKAVVIYSSDAIDSIAIRLRQQINENSKQLCWHHVIPEMNHNELVGWEHPKFVTQQSAVVMLRSSYEHPRVGVRFGINEQVIAKHTSHIHTIQAKGNSLLAQLFYLLHFSDWVSLYLAEANGVDPTPVKVIDFLKNELAAKK
jgi:glucose/mannose-6-phosphate isomerase